MLYVQKRSWCENSMEVQNQFTSLLFKTIFSKDFFLSHYYKARLSSAHCWNILSTYTFPLANQ